MNKIYENIKKRRLELNMTQEQLAEKMGYSDKTMISKIEKGQIDISYSKIIAFAEVLKVEPEDLMGWTDQDFAIKPDYYIQELGILIENATPEQKENLLAIAKALLHKQ